MVQRMKELEQRRRTLQDEEIDWSTITLPPTEVRPQSRFTQLRPILVQACVYARYIKRCWRGLSGGGAERSCAGYDREPRREPG